MVKKALFLELILFGLSFRVHFEYSRAAETPLYVPFSSALFTTLDTVFSEHGTDRAMFRSLNHRLLSFRTSQYVHRLEPP